MITNAIKITSSGQVTLPKRIRNILNTNTISFEVDANNEIKVRPIYSVAGALKSYSKDLTFNEAREKAEQELINDWKK
jgi:bifunctional DNA-binding transcriptional regulator/antitoxin component of YhaV-PrlF toxin-antitoxin module